MASDQPFSTRLSEAMTSRGLTDRDVAPWFGIGSNTVNRWRNGRVVPEPEPTLASRVDAIEEAVALLTSQLAEVIRRMPPRAK
jgi:hypothetical protein